MTEKAKRLGCESTCPHSVAENELPIVFAQDGLTKREYFSGLAMRGLLSAPGGVLNAGSEKVAEWSVKYADALLEELSKEENEQPEIDEL